MTPASQALLDGVKKTVDDALKILLDHAERADTLEMLEDFDDHLGDVSDRTQGHMSAIEDDLDEEDDE